MNPSSDLREIIKNQERQITALRSDLSARSKVIDQLTAKCKEVTQRLAEVQVQLEEERAQHAAAAARLETLEQRHAEEMQALAAAHADEIAQRAQVHADDIARRDAAHADDVAVFEARLAEMEQALAAESAARAAESEARRREVTDHASLIERVAALEAEVGHTKEKLDATARALEKAERDAIQEQLARDAAFHDLHMQSAAAIEAAVEAARREAAMEREQLTRAHEQALVTVRDKAIAQALAVARERKKQTSS